MSNIIGLGADIVDISSIRRWLEISDANFVSRCFTAAEQKLAEKSLKKVEFYAGRFAAKEAVLKAIRTGWSQGISWTDIEILQHPSGRTEVQLNQRCQEIATSLGVTEWLLSISYSEYHAVATALAISNS